jgi:toxin ParE1/3/4
MKEWSVQLSKQADIDLRKIYEYIAFTLLEPVTAGKLVQRIENRIFKLNTMPQSYAVYPKEPWKSRGLRRINEGKYAIFFVPAEIDYTVIVTRIMYGGRDIENILEDTPQYNS